ncbi:MAG: C4-type zinc ribbon domain-containing protein [Actinomycetota bacterium]|nr:C4-type zinc ribbon domain-containing protein [Actinomycetota bacterium]
MSGLQSLIRVQERDTATDRLRYRRANLPERSLLSGLERRLADLEARLTDVRARRDAVGARQSRLEEEVRSLDARVQEIDRRLYSGTVTASRELQAMSAEVSAIKARRSAVEDAVLEAMEEHEPLALELASLERQRAELVGESEHLRATLAESEVAIDAEIAAEEDARADAAQSVASDLLSTYEGLRSRLGGVGASRLVGSSCSGCHLVLPAAEVARVKREPPDALVFCDQCGRILVR